MRAFPCKDKGNLEKWLLQKTQESGSNSSLPHGHSQTKSGVPILSTKSSVLVIRALISSHHNKETILFTIDPHYGN